MWDDLDDYRCSDCGRPSEMCRCGDDEEQEIVKTPNGNKRVIAVIGEPSPNKKLINDMIQQGVRVEVAHDYSQMEYKLKEEFRKQNDELDSLRYAVTKIGDGEEVPSHSLTFKVLKDRGHCKEQTITFTPNYKEEN